jgi:hypothetical protein
VKSGRPRNGAKGRVNRVARPNRREEGQLLPRWLIRRLYRSTFQPDVREERRVRDLLYGERRVVSRVEPDVERTVEGYPPHVYTEVHVSDSPSRASHGGRTSVGGANLIALDRRSHDRLHRGEDPHRR